LTSLKENHSQVDPAVSTLKEDIDSKYQTLEKNFNKKIGNLEETLKSHTQNLAHIEEEIRRIRDEIQDSISDIKNNPNSNSDSVDLSQLEKNLVFFFFSNYFWNEKKQINKNK